MTLQDVLVQIKEGLSLIQSAIVNAITGFLASFGINVPHIAIQLILVGLVLIFFLKGIGKLPWIVLILLGLFLISFLIGLFESI